MTLWLTLLFWVLAHSLWQAAAVWLAYRGMRWLRSEMPSWSRSAAATLAVFTIPALSVSTGMALISQALAASGGTEETGGADVAILAVAWAMAVLCLGLRLAREMHRSVSGREGGGTPRVVGWLRPRIVIPAELTRLLTAGQLSGITAHEQEHIRAGDPLLNLLQCVLDLLYFFNPFYRRMSSVARLEREFRCDDVAASRVGALVYLRALVAVAGGGSNGQRCALGSSGHLEQRAERLAHPPRARGGKVELVLALAGSAIALLVLPNAAAVPATHVNAVSWQTRMRPVGRLVRNVVTPPLQTAGRALKSVTR